MNLFIQIPCFNEEKTLPDVVRDIPKTISGIDQIEIMIVDDGSTDKTIEIARSLGIRHIVALGTNRGLATAFKRGTEYALSHGADILVNTDGDNQYFGGDIAKLVQPILNNNADVVVGCRPILEHKEFSPVKKILQLLGSWTLRKISKTTVRDAASGFRAFSRETLQRVFIHSRFSYCMETLIQAGNSGLRVASVDIRVNPKTRESRLFKSIPQYIKKSGGTMLAMFILYRPAAFFTLCSIPAWLVTFFLGLRAIILAKYLSVPIKQFLPSLILLIITSSIAFLLLLLALIGNLMRAQRCLTEEVLFYERKQASFLSAASRKEQK
jgi:glycosyltransferase involved in cell wall biosynthesis